jgi:hypothetical protein
MRNDFFQRESVQSFMQQQVIAPQHQCVDVMMLARYAAEVQVNRPSAGEVEGRAQAAQHFGDFKYRFNFPPH